MELSLTEKRLLAIAAVCGPVNKQELNGACNTDGINKDARKRAFKSLVAYEIFPPETIGEVIAGDYKCLIRVYD